MLSIAQAQRKAADAGTPIHMPLKSFTVNGVHIRRGQLTMVAAAPGCGKSAFAQSVVQRGYMGQKNTTLYISADSGADVLFKRAIAIETGWEMEYIDEIYGKARHGELVEIAENALSHVRLVFDSSPDEQEFLDQLAAYVTVYGDFPEVIVVDNLKDLYVDGGGADGGGEFAALENALVFLHNVARQTNAAVITLHHVIGEFDNGGAVPQGGIRGKVTKTPEMVLTLHRAGNQMGVSPVKNRNGRADSSGQWILNLRANMATMQFEDAT